MHATVLNAHNVIRWAVLSAALWAVLQSWQGHLARRPWRRADFLAGLTFTTVLNVQVMVGIMVYVRSPLVRPLFDSVRYAGSALPATFFTVLHPLSMLAAASLAQGVYSAVKRTEGDARKLRRAALGYTAAACLIAAAVPWPFLPYGRPLTPSAHAEMP